MTVLQQVIIFVIVYLVIYSLINRICTCFERCALAKAYGEYKENEKTVVIKDNLPKTDHE